MTLVDSDGTKLTLEPLPGVDAGPHACLLVIGEESFELRPDSAAALAGALMTWVAERTARAGFF